jgi:hypothetical protein
MKSHSQTPLSFQSGLQQGDYYMRVLNRSLAVLLTAVSSLALSGCLGTNYPPTAPSLVNESASGTGFIAARGTGFEDMTTTSGGTGITGATIGTDVDNAVFTAFTNASSGAYGFIVDLPQDSTPLNTTGNAAVFNLSAGFAAAPAGVFPTGTLQATVPTYPSADISSVGVVTGGSVSNGNILVDKFGTAEALQDSEYGIWAENGTTAGLSATTASTVGAFAFGTPTTIMPSTGTANYVGGASGVATSTNGGLPATGNGGEFAGTANLTANFGVGGGTITGAITSIKYENAGTATVGTMNNINFNSGTIAGNTFTGTTNVGAAPAVSANNLDITGATGTFGGQFNGLNAAEVAGTFNVTGGGNTAKVIGSFGAKQ